MEQFCSGCGQEAMDGSSFCHYCGRSLVTEDPGPQEPRKPRSGAGTFRSNWKKASLISVAAIAVIAVFAYQATLIRDARSSAMKAASDAEQAKKELDQTRIETLSDLGAQKKEVQTMLAKSTSSVDVTSVVNKWNSVIAYVYCEYSDWQGAHAQSGSGTLLINADGTRSVLTNYHVVSDDTGKLVNDCSVKFPTDPKTYLAYSPDISTTDDTEDVAYIKISSPDATLKSFTASGRKYCENVPNIGDRIVVLGYPGIGSQTSITATEGIVSGYDGNFYITSAKVAHGNSGGAAIDMANNCFLGIPTYVESDTAESLARILKWQAF